LVLLFLALEGCALRLPSFGRAAPVVVVDPETQAAAWRAHRVRMERIMAFDLQGRVAIASDKEGGNASFTWHQDGAAYQMRIMAPLAQGTFELNGDRLGVSLRTPQGETVDADTPEALLQRALGWQLPLSGLRFWALGIPAPGAVDHLELDPEGRLSELQQSGWRITVQQYDPVAGLPLPAKMSMVNDQTKVRIVFSEWKLPSP
jgi:outer membrane lipoprotein LolB